MRAARPILPWIAALCVGLSISAARAEAPAPTEQQLKAVFLFNFTHFVAWPADAFGSPTEPFVIGVLGGDALADELDKAVHDERLDAHPLQVRRLRGIEDVRDCKILFIDRSQGADLDRVLGRLAHTDTLTVSDLDGAAGRGVIIQLAMQNNRIQLLVNADSAHSAGLTISSNLLRLSKVAHSAN